MNTFNSGALIEAVLFASGEPLEIARIAEALDADIEATRVLLADFSRDLDERGSGIRLVKMEDKYQLTTRAEYADTVRNILEIKRNTPLSQAAFEVLAVVAYNQPITKAYVEQVRGVDCSGVIATLSQRGLIEEKGRLDLPGRPLLYGTTAEFLKCFGLTTLNDLPDLPQREAVQDGEQQLTFAQDESDPTKEEEEQ
ncbi:MAG: SMC-Scp complex subunit ScpB [Clostridiales bacterium]|nr:SMC-Scp complex subunit ScpB [Clostridiales bacterium]